MTSDTASSLKQADGHRDRHHQPPEDAQRAQPRDVDGDGRGDAAARRRRLGAGHRLPRRGNPGVRLRRGHLRVRGEPQGHRDRASLQQADGSRLRGDPQLPQAHRGHGLRLLHGRRDGPRHGVRSAIRRRGLEVRHPGGAAVHHLRARARPSARGSRGSRLREGHPLLRAHRWRPTRRRASASSSVCSRWPSSSPTTYEYLRKVAANAPLSIRGTKTQVRAIFEGITDGTGTSCGSSGSRPSTAKTTRKAPAPSSRSARPASRAARRLSAARGRSPVRVAVLTSTPLDPREGSGTFVALAGFEQGLRRLGHEVEIRPLRRRTGFHTFDRWLYNAEVARRPPARPDLVVGCDLDGFLWARRRRVPFVVMLKGIIADELRNERGWVRVLLGVQARWERRNTERADLRAGAQPLLGGRRDGGVRGAARACRRWCRRPSTSPSGRRASPPPPASPRGGATVLAVGRMYPRKRFVDLLHAAARLRSDLPAARVRIVGKGPDWEAVVRLPRRASPRRDGDPARRRDA